ncbi:MAG TPA: glycerate kinase, partial [Polyangiaceae bacterium]|nr:glycerate kinase [Polyangiaceae bacterium]
LADVLGEKARFAGAGAAGAIPASLVAVLGARVVAGSDFVLDLIGFDAALRGASLVISAEGRFDAQSAMNKGPVAVARRARARGVPTIVLAGAMETRELDETHVAAALSITRTPCELDQARSSTADWLALTAEQVLRVFMLGQSAARAVP